MPPVNRGSWKKRVRKTRERTPRRKRKKRYDRFEKRAAKNFEKCIIYRKFLLDTHPEMGGFWTFRIVWVKNCGFGSCLSNFSMDESSLLRKSRRTANRFSWVIFDQNIFADITEQMIQGKFDFKNKEIFWIVFSLNSISNRIYMTNTR